MNRTIKQTWLAKLRSGAYKQARNRLRDGDLFGPCGILCDMHPDGNWNGRAYQTVTGGYYCTVPPEVLEWSGLDLLDEVSIMAMNDIDGLEFSEISDWIEKEIR